MSPAEDFESLELGSPHIFWFKKSENKNINSMKKSPRLGGKGSLSSFKAFDNQGIELCFISMSA